MNDVIVIHGGADLLITALMRRFNVMPKKEVISSSKEKTEKKYVAFLKGKSGTNY